MSELSLGRYVGDIDVADMAFAGQRGGRVLMCVFVFFSKGGVYAISMR